MRPPLYRRGGSLSVMAYREREVTCVVCGHTTIGRYRPGVEWRCLQCSIQRAVDHNTDLAAHRGVAYAKSLAAGERTRRQIADKQGPLYERWLSGMAAAVERGRAQEASPATG